MKTFFAIALISLIMASQAFIFAPSLAKYDLNGLKDAAELKSFTKPRSSKDALNDFVSGILGFFKINAQNDLINCFDEKNAAIYLGYYYGWAVATSANATSQVLKANLNFFNGVGKKLEAQIPASVTTCVQQSEDSNRLNQALGFNLFDQKFVNSLIHVMKTQPALYTFIFSNMWDAFRSGDHTNAGIWMGSLYSIVRSNYKAANPN